MVKLSAELARPLALDQREPVSVTLPVSIQESRSPLLAASWASPSRGVPLVLPSRMALSALLSDAAGLALGGVEWQSLVVASRSRSPLLLQSRPGVLVSRWQVAAWASDLLDCCRKSPSAEVGLSRLRGVGSAIQQSRFRSRWPSRLERCS